MNSCDEYGEWISARIDDELDRSELAELEHHLASCEPCRSRDARFRDVDRALLAPTSDAWKVAPSRRINNESASGEGDDWSPSDRLATATSLKNNRVGPSELPPELRTPTSRSRLWLRSAAAAALLICATALFIQRSADASWAVESAATLDVLNEQRAQDQQAVIDALELDLRAMRLETRLFKLEPALTQPVHRKIHRLMRRLHALRAE